MALRADFLDSPPGVFMAEGKASQPATAEQPHLWTGSSETF